jgi:hypothetical protein
MRETIASLSALPQVVLSRASQLFMEQNQSFEVKGWIVSWVQCGLDPSDNTCNPTCSAVIQVIHTKCACSIVQQLFHTLKTTPCVQPAASFAVSMPPRKKPKPRATVCHLSASALLNLPLDLLVHILAALPCRAQRVSRLLSQAT